MPWSSMGESPCSTATQVVGARQSRPRFDGRRSALGHVASRQAFQGSRLRGPAAARYQEYGPTLPIRPSFQATALSWPIQVPLSRKTVGSLRPWWGRLPKSTEPRSPAFLMQNLRSDPQVSRDDDAGLTHRRQVSRAAASCSNGCPFPRQNTKRTFGDENA